MSRRDEAIAAFEALAKRESHPFDCAVLGPAMAGIVLDVQVLTVDEHDDAAASAEAYVQRRFGDAARDASKVDDACKLEVICRAFTLDGARVFPSADWLRERFSTDKLGVLLNAYNKVVRETSLHATDVSGDFIMAVAKRCATDDNADEALLVMSRDFLVEAFIRLAREHFKSSS